MELSKEQTDAITRLNETGVVFEFGKITFRKSARKKQW